MSQFTRFSLHTEPPIARIALANPPLNIIDLPIMGELLAAVEKVETKPEISTVIFEGSGKGFSAGVDVAAHTPENVPAMLDKFHRVIRALVSTKKVTIAKVHGNCLGGGAELAMVCDLVYTTEDAQWGFPEIRLGCFPPVAVTGLTALVGRKRAAELILTGGTITGAHAAEIGIATRTVTVERLDQEIKQVVAKLSALSPATMGITKKAMYAWDSLQFDKGLAHAEKIYLDELMKTADAAEGIQAFTEKRPPKWQGS